MIPVYVVAKDYRDFQLWCDDHGYRPTDHRKVRPLLSAERIIGHQFFPGQVTYTERSGENRDALEMADRIRHATRTTRADAVSKVKERAFRYACGIDHAHECCFAHETHSTPHLGCPIADGRNR
jgi:hypothetical protein